MGDAVGLGELEGVGVGVGEALGELEAVAEGEGEGVGLIPPPPRSGKGTLPAGVIEPRNKKSVRTEPIICPSLVFTLTP